MFIIATEVNTSLQNSRYILRQYVYLEKWYIWYFFQKSQFLKSGTIFSFRYLLYHPCRKYAIFLIQFPRSRSMYIGNIGNGCNFRWQSVKRVIFRVVWKPTLSSLDQSKRLLLQFEDQKRRVVNRFLHCHVVVGHPLIVGVDGCQVVLPQFRNENGCHWVFLFSFIYIIRGVQVNTEKKEKS